jgi:hypothetical protein
LVSSTLGHLLGTAECMVVRGPDRISSVDLAPAAVIDSASTIRLQVPEGETEDVEKIGANRRGA